MGHPLDVEALDQLETCYLLLQDGDTKHKQLIEQFRELNGFVYQLNSAGRYESVRQTLAPTFENFEKTHRRHLQNIQRFDHNLREIEKLRRLKTFGLENSWLREALRSPPPVAADLELPLREYSWQKRKGGLAEVLFILFLIVGLLVLYYYLGVFDLIRGSYSN